VDIHRALQRNEAGLIGYWSFDGGNGQVRVDLTGNPNDVQLGQTGCMEASDPAWGTSDAPTS